MKTKFVYYNVKTGFITDILKTRKRGRGKYIECPIEDVIGFLDGSEGIANWVVAYNNDLKKTILIKKDNIIRLRAPSNRLSKVPYKANTLSDLTIVYYSDNVLEVSLDMSRISPLYQTNFRKDVTFERGTEIRITLKEKDSGNLLKEIVVDAQDLLDSGQMFFDLYDHIYSDNVEFFVYKLFESYSWSKGKVKLISPIKDKIKFDIHKADTKKRSTDFSYHLIMKATEKGIRITNNIENLKLIRFHEQIEFFVVDKHDPNILYDKFTIVEEDLDSKTMMFPLDCDVRGKTILYNHKYISVLLEG